MTAAPAATTTTTAATPPRLAARGLAKSFGDRVALAGVSFDVAPGEILGLLGPNGAGKTTAFRLLSGLLPPDAGDLALDGRAARPSDPAYRARLAVVFQEPSLDLKLTARENLALGAALYGLPRREAARRIDAALALMELGARADEPTAAYSGGMRRRIEIARGLLHDPDVLLLDEPYQGFDGESFLDFWEQVWHWRDEGRAVVVVTHRPEQLKRVDAVLDLGRQQVGAGERSR